MKVPISLRMSTLIVSVFFTGIIFTGKVFAQTPDRAVHSQERQQDTEVRAQEAQERAQAHMRDRSTPAMTDVEERIAEILERVEAKRATTTARLDEKRMEVCEQRASKIDDIVSRSNNNSKRHLSVFKTTADRTIAFYNERQLKVDNYAQLISAVEEKELQATAAIEAASEVTFECAEQDSNNVGVSVREVMKSQHAALQEYRIAIKNLIVGVQQAIPESEVNDPARNETECADINQNPTQ